MSVTQVALEVGYNDVLSVIVMFRDAFGNTPAHFLRSRPLHEKAPRR